MARCKDRALTSLPTSAPGQQLLARMKRSVLLLCFFTAVVFADSRNISECPANKSVLLLGRTSEGVEAAALSTADDAFSYLSCYLSLIFSKVCANLFDR